MLGINIIGKIYKSKNVKTLPNGFEIDTKFKSNFGGIKDLKLKFVVRNGFVDIRFNHSLLLNVENLDDIDYFQNEDYILLNIGSDFRVRNILRPDSYNLKKHSIEFGEEKKIKNGLYIPLVVTSDLNYFTIVDLYLVPSVYEDKEYIELIIKNQNNVRFYINK